VTRHIAAVAVALVITLGLVNMFVLMGHDRRMVPWIALALFCVLLLAAAGVAGRRMLAKAPSSKP